MEKACKERIISCVVNKPQIDKLQKKFDKLTKGFVLLFPLWCLFFFIPSLFQEYFNWQSHESYSHFSKTSNAKHIVRDCLGLSVPEMDSRKMGTLIPYCEPSWKKGGKVNGTTGLPA